MTASRSTSEAETVPSERVSSTSMSRRRGLCMTCRHAAYCTFPIYEERPVFQCEEFEIESMPAAKHPIVTATEEVRPNTSNNKRLLGLCFNCDLRDTCKFPMPEGGVWHCEEYE